MNYKAKSLSNDEDILADLIMNMNDQGLETELDRALLLELEQIGKVDLYSSEADAAIPESSGPTDPSDPAGPTVFEEIAVIDPVNAPSVSAEIAVSGAISAPVETENALPRSGGGSDMSAEQTTGSRGLGGVRNEHPSPSGDARGAGEWRTITLPGKSRGEVRTLVRLKALVGCERAECHPCGA